LSIVAPSHDDVAEPLLQDEFNLDRACSRFADFHVRDGDELLADNKSLQLVGALNPPNGACRRVAELGVVLASICREITAPPDFGGVGFVHVSIVRQHSFNSDGARNPGDWVWVEAIVGFDEMDREMGR